MRVEDPSLVFERALHELSVAVGSLLDFLIDAYGSLAVFSELVVRRIAIECYGITEADIRSISGRTVRLWNGRRIEVEL